MNRDDSVEKASPTRGDERSRSRERVDEPHGRASRRLVDNPFRSPRRRQPRPVDEWLPPHGGAYVAPAEETPRTEAEPSATGNDPPGAQDDVDMGSDNGYGRMPQIWNAQAIPQPPVFKGSTKTERRAFMREYQKPFAMPVSVCMDQFSKRRIALFDFNRDHNDITDDEWVAWFKAAFEEDPQDLEVQKKRLQGAIRFDTRILDAESRVGRMLDDLMRSLEHDHQEWVLHQKGKMVVDVMSKAIRPESLKTAVLKQLQLQRNKVLKSDVFCFVNWLRTFAAGHQLYVGLDEDHRLQANAKNVDGLKGKKSGDGKGGATKENGKPAVKADVANQKEGEQKPKKGCLKCGDTGHRVAKCPKVAPGEAEALLEAQMKKWKDGIKALKSQSSRQSTEHGALVEGKVRVDNVLLDTGADVNMVSLGVINALDTAGVKADEITLEAPRFVYPYGNDAKPLAMTRRVKFNSLTLDTACGPLVLRGFQAWIDDASPLVELIVSRPVMEILGFNVDDLLVGARQEKAEWDVSAEAKVEPTGC
ncbi:hypothetical protein AC1031_019466 [Aphanomyces cochlioides]|nr:hypothetical protein AC1031_019466 [Aphanomyces cochlioides]